MIWFDRGGKWEMKALHATFIHLVENVDSLVLWITRRKKSWNSSFILIIGDLNANLLTWNWKLQPRRKNLVLSSGSWRMAHIFLGHSGTFLSTHRNKLEQFGIGACESEFCTCVPCRLSLLTHAYHSLCYSVGMRFSLGAPVAKAFTFCRHTVRTHTHTQSMTHKFAWRQCHLPICHSVKYSIRQP